MLYDFIIMDKGLGKPLYRQIYLSVRRAIENGTLKKGSKLPSIRKLSADRGISKTTVASAYDQLCAEGYIKNKPQSGYYVAAQFDSLPKASYIYEQPKQKHEYFEYDFSGKSIDESIIDITQWRKNIKDIINRNYLLTSYGDVQGEPALRNALQAYALGTRSVAASSENIVVGAGTQAVLYILCSLLRGGKKVALEKAGFVQSEYIFRSFDYDIHYFETDEAGATINSLNEIKPDIILINPNFTGTKGVSMPVTRRLEIIEWVKSNGAVIIEDDYNGELRYSTHPMPCVQNYDTENTVYIGSFSKVLLPSVRLSYMVLPQRLLELYGKNKRFMNQTASKTEQLALAKYIENRKFDAHLRRARRVYLEKSRLMTAAVKKYFKNTETGFNETSLYLTVKLKENIDIGALEEKLREKSVKIMPYAKNDNTLALSFSGISNEKIDEGIKIISETITAEGY